MWRPFIEYKPLLGEALKSDLMLDALETYDVQVIYEYDRTHENLPDEYYAACHDLGLALRFDQDQKLQDIYLYLAEAEGFSVANLDDTDIQVFDSKPKVRAYGEKNGIQLSEGVADFMGEEHDWIRLDDADHTIHYDFREGFLSLITVSAKSDEEL